MSRGRAEMAHRVIDAGERALERAAVEAKQRPVATALFTAAEVVGTVVVFGLAETVLAGAAMYAVYRVLTARPRLAPASRRAPAARLAAGRPG